MNLFEPNWQHLLGSKISMEWENAPSTISTWWNVSVLPKAFDPKGSWNSGKSFVIEKFTGYSFILQHLLGACCTPVTRRTWNWKTSGLLSHGNFIFTDCTCTSVENDGALPGRNEVPNHSKPHRKKLYNPQRYLFQSLVLFIARKFSCILIQGFSISVLVTFGLDNFFFVRAVLCIIGCLAVSQASTHSLPLASPSPVELTKCLIFPGGQNHWSNLNLFFYSVVPYFIIVFVCYKDWE